jgi:hypothetical protein
VDEASRKQLAQRLGAMKLNEARGEIRALDRDANMVFWRNAMWDETQTRYLLPNAGLSITLVEKTNEHDDNKTIGGGPRGTHAIEVEYHYVEARVDLLDRPAHKRGTNGPAPLKANGWQPARK